MFKKLISFLIFTVTLFIFNVSTYVTELSSNTSNPFTGTGDISTETRSPFTGENYTSADVEFIHFIDGIKDIDLDACLAGLWTPPGVSPKWTEPKK